MSRALVSRVLLGLALFAVGCAVSQEEGESDPSASEDAIIGGRETFAHPAVGVTRLNGDTGCSGTLVRSNVVLLAAHCFGADRTDIAPWQFEIRKSANDRYRYVTGEGWVKSRAGAGEADLALLRLREHVPASVAKPIPLATAWPWWTTKLELLGFGCTERGGGGAGVKRIIEKRHGPGWSLGWVTQATCPGDSGGALLDSNGPAVLGVLSGYRGNGYDLFGDVVKYRAELEAVIARWQ
jgi:hypothetical protein